MSNGSKVAVVTGGGSGIGRAVALGLNEAGYNVVVAGRRGNVLEDTCAAATGKMLAVTCDVAKDADVTNLFEKTREAFGRVDVLFNNAGLGAPPVPMDELPVEQWRQVVDVNLTGVFLCAREAMKMMKAQQPKGGRIINNGSISAHSPRPYSAPYTSTKHAVTGLTKAIALEGRPHNIACSQIDIGNAATEMTDAMAAGILQADMTTRAVEARMDVRHVADAVCYMANLPLDTNVLNMTLKATTMPFEGRG